ncbi:MAG: IS110 family transposase [Syntrophorhabdales bacterium]
MALFVGIDVAKDKFDACGIGEEGEKVFSLTATMDKKGFENLIFHLRESRSLLLGLESTACYHIALFSYLTAKGYRVVIINPLLISNFVKLQLRKTKTDKKDALTIAQFLMLRKEALETQTFSADLMELRDLARRRERLTDQVTKLKGNMKRVLSVTFPELEHLTGVFAKSILELLIRFPSADALRKVDVDAVAALVVPRSWGRKSRAWVETLMTTASSSIGVSSPAKELVLRQDAALLLYIQEQIKETTKALMGLCTERIKKDAEILTSIQGIGETTALNFLVEMGGDVTLYKNDKKLIAAAGLDPSTYQSGKYEGSSKISKRGNRHLRRVIWLMAKTVVFSNEVFRTYFYKRRREGLCYKMAIMATAHKLIRVMFAMLVHQKCFQQGGI